jgi:hypothetical protein
MSQVGIVPPNLRPSIRIVQRGGRIGGTPHIDKLMSCLLANYITNQSDRQPMRHWKPSFRRTRVTSEND